MFSGAVSHAYNAAARHFSEKLYLLTPGYVATLRGDSVSPPLKALGIGLQELAKQWQFAR